MKEIRLYKDKGVALVDDEDFERVSRYKWHIDRGYAAMTVPGKGIMYMHRFVNNTPRGMSTDHINRDKLDNRRSNLRTCTQRENNTNTKLRDDNTSGHRGVTWHKNDKKWQAQINIQGRLLYLGQYKELADAVKAQKHAFKQVYEVDL